MEWRYLRWLNWESRKWYWFNYNQNDELEVVVSNYGCTLVKVLMKDQAGNVDDVVLGYDDFKSYQTLDAYIGALVGRVANRIKKGTLN